jgi:hypothetical protein
MPAVAEKTWQEKLKMPEAEACLLQARPSGVFGGNCIDIPVLFGYPIHNYPRNSKG